MAAWTFAGMCRGSRCVTAYQPRFTRVRRPTATACWSWSSVTPRFRASCTLKGRDPTASSSALMVSRVRALAATRQPWAGEAGNGAPGRRGGANCARGLRNSPGTERVVLRQLSAIRGLRIADNCRKPLRGSDRCRDCHKPRGTMLRPGEAPPPRGAAHATFRATPIARPSSRPTPDRSAVASRSTVSLSPRTSLRHRLHRSPART